MNIKYKSKQPFII